MAVENQSEGFPVGMRVLAVDDDPISLKVLETFLRKCHYHVTTMNQSIEALRMLRENRNMFDLIISDVNMPEMDGFKLLELVEEYEMDLPVILLSAHSDAKLVMKGVTNGACDYLLKPVRIEELKNIWQHVLRRRTKIDSKDQNSNNVSGSSGEGGGQNIVEDRADHMKILGKRRKDQDGDNDDDEPSSSQKKPRVVWSVELHRKFLAAVNQLGLDKAVPKKIHHLMNVEGVTRENVSSHLQKYRLHLKKVTQQASMVSASSDGSNSLFRMGAIDRSGKIPNTTLPSYASGGIFGPLNSPACLNLGEISSSAALIRPVQSQNISSCSLSNIANIQPFIFPSYQSSNLLPGIPTSIELNQSESSGFAVASSFPNSNANSSSFPYVSTNSLMLQGNSQQTYNTRAFRNQSSAGTELFDTSICASSNYLLEYNSCTENSQTGAQLPKFPASSLQDCVDTFNNDYNSPADSSSSVVSVVPLGGARNELRCQEGLNANIVQPSSFTPRQSWEGHKLDYNQSMSCGFNLETRLSSTPLMRWSQF